MNSARKIAFFGIGAYIISVLSSIEDLQGNQLAPTVIIVLSSIATIVFIVKSSIHFWKNSPYLSIILAISYVIPPLLSLISLVFSISGYLILPINMAKILYFFAYWTIVLTLFSSSRINSKENS